MGPKVVAAINSFYHIMCQLNSTQICCCLVLNKNIHFVSERESVVRGDSNSVTRKKSLNVYKKLPKNDFTRKMIDFDSFTKLPTNVGDLDN